MDENLINRIISAAYGDCSIWEKFRIKRIRKKNPEAERIYNSYHRAAVKVHSLKEIKCPDQVLKKAEAEIKPLNLTAGFLKPAAAFAIIIIAAITAIITIVNKPEPRYTAAEVRTAEIQAKESLAFVGRLLNKTTTAVSNEILPEKVSKPVKKGFNIINNLLIGG